MFKNKQKTENRTKNTWARSMQELQSVQTITTCGIMGAAAIALKFVATINFGQYIRIGFSNIPQMIVSTLFGPALGGIFGAVMDLLKYFVKPDGAYFPGFTISALLGGIIYGLFFYQKPITMARVLMAQLVIKVFVNIFCNTFWLAILYKQGILLLLPERVITNAIMLPVDTILCYSVLKLTGQIWKQFRIQK